MSWRKDKTEFVNIYESKLKINDSKWWREGQANEMLAGRDFPFHTDLFDLLEI